MDDQSIDYRFPTGHTSPPTPPLADAPRSRSEWAESRLRHAIVSGELAPGERIRVETLAERWQVSATPLREALRTLAAEGLVVLSAQRGARVADLSVAELIEVYELRLLLEPYAFRLALERGEAAWRSQVAEAWRQLRAAQSRRVESLLDLEPAHADFHVALVAGCGSDSLVRLVGALSTRALRFRILLAPSRPGGNRRSLAEHRRLAQLARGGDPAEGARFLARHLAWPLQRALGPGALERIVDRLEAFDPQPARAALAALRQDAQGPHDRSPA